jgi:beta-fructofuranosidase
MLRLADRWIWDFWIADTGADYHLFFLQALRSVGDPSLRHHQATIGHARSRDLVTWDGVADALGPGQSGDWDDLATWTGSVLRANDRWWLFYTGLSSREQGAVQRIGAATSSDLETWTKHPMNPLLEADGRWYAGRDTDDDVAWRDPWVFPDPGGDGFHALITARGRSGDPERRGVVAHAWSPDLERWEARRSVTEPGAFGELEVPQVVEVDGGWLLLFSVHVLGIAPGVRERLGITQSTVFACPGPTALGPFDVEPDARPISAPGLYAGRLVRDRAGAWQFLGFVDRDQSGAFGGTLADPQPFDPGSFLG